MRRLAWGLVVVSMCASSLAASQDGPRGVWVMPDAVDAVTGTGSFDEATALRALRTRRSMVTSCYETALRRQPDARGTFALSFTISESGSVGNVAAAHDTLGHPEVIECIFRVARGLRFDPGPVGGSVTLTIPMTFEPGPAQPRPQQQRPRLSDHAGS